MRHWPCVVVMLCLLQSPVVRSSDDTGATGNDAIRAMVVEAEALSARDLGAAAALARKAAEQAEAANDRALAIYAQLTWADALLKARKLDEGDA